MYILLYAEFLEPQGRMLSRWVIVNSSTVHTVCGNDNTNTIHTNVVISEKILDEYKRLTSHLTTRLYSYLFVAQHLLLHIYSETAVWHCDRRHATQHSVNMRPESLHSGPHNVKCMGKNSDAFFITLHFI